MKNLIIGIIGLLLVAASLPAQTFDQRVDELQKVNLAQRDDLVAAQVESREAKAAAKQAEQKLGDLDAAHRAEIEALKAEHAAVLKKRDKTIADQQRTLNKWYVRLVISLADWVWWITTVGGALYLLATIGGVVNPGSALGRLSGMLISALPIANVCEAISGLWRRTMLIDAEEVPVVAGRRTKRVRSSVKPRPAVADQQARVALDAMASDAAAAEQAGPPAPAAPATPLVTMTSIPGPADRAPQVMSLGRTFFGDPASRGGVR